MSELLTQPGGAQNLEQLRAQVEALAAQTNVAERGKIFSSIQRHLTTEQFEDRERELVNRNLQELQKRMGDGSEAGKMVESLRKTMTEPEKVIIPDEVTEPSPSDRKSLPTGVPVAVPANVQPSAPETSKLRKYFPKTWDVREWTPEQIAVTSTLTLGGIGLLYLARRWWKGRKEKSDGGAEQPRRGGILSWLKWIPILGLAGFGLYKGHQYLKGNLDWYRQRMEGLEQKISGWKKPAETAAGVAVTAGGVGAGAATEAGEIALGAGEVALDAAAVVNDSARVILESFRGGDVGAALEALKKSGGSFIESGGKFFVWWGKELIRLPYEYGSQWTTFLTQGGNQYELGTVIGELGIMYVFNTAVLKALLTGQVRIPNWGTAGRVIGAPLYLIKDGYQTVHILTRDRAALKVKLGGILGRRFFLERIAVKHAKEFAASGSLDDLELAVRQWMRFDNEIAIAEQRMGRGLGMHFDENSVRSLRVKQGKVASAIHEALKGYQLPPDAPEWVENLWKARDASSAGFEKVLENPGSDLRQAVSSADVDVHVNAETPRPSSESAVEKPASSEPPKNNTRPSSVDEGGPVRKLAPEVETKPGLRLYDPEGKLGQGASAAVASTEAANAIDPRVERQLQAFKGNKNIADALAMAGENASEVERLLFNELRALDAPTLQMINESGKAKKLLAGAVATGKPAEMARIVSAARRATALRVGWNGIGAAGDLFGLYIAYCDIMANRDRIAETENAALKEIYGKAYYLYAGEGAASATGLIVGGIAIYQAWTAGGSLIVALGAPAGMVMLPIAAAAMGARYTYKKLEESSEYHSLTQRDLERKYSPGQILHHIGKSTHLTNVNWSQDLFLSENMAQTGNEVARSEGYRAYFAQLAASAVPRVTTLDINDDTLKDLREMERTSPVPAGAKTNLEYELENMQRERVGMYVKAAERYIAYKTNDSFDLVTPEMLRNASLYAEMQYEQWERTGRTDFELPKNTVYWTEAETMIAARLMESQRLVTQDICALSADGEKFENEAPAKILYLIRDDLAACERTVLNTNYSNWTSWSAWKGEEGMQKMARGVIAEDLWNVIHSVAAQVRGGRKLQDADVLILTQRLRSALQQNPQECARRGIESSHPAYFERAGAFSARLSMSGMLDYLDSYRLSAPRTLGADRASALPITNLEYYAKGNTVTVDLPEGVTKGYVSITEPYVMRPSRAGVEPVQMKEPGAYEFAAGEYQFWKGTKQEGNPGIVLIVRETGRS
ncbi:MAG: hypothetical protein WCV62_00355 [Candidatus Peribacteraceae bacterium]